MVDKKNYRIILGLAAVGGIVFFFIKQRYDFAGNLLLIDHSTAKFIVNKTIRFFINDLLAIVLIYALFAKRQYVLFAFWVQLLGVFFLLLPYFILKIIYPVYNGPLISFLHRIVLNPTLLLLLIPAFYYQQQNFKKERL